MLVHPVIRLAATVVLCLALAGCFDVEQEIAVQGDGTARITARVSMDREMEDVFAAAEAVARLSSDPAIAAAGGPGGLCSPSMLKVAPRAGDMGVEVRRGTSGNRMICEVVTPGVRLAPEIVDPLGLKIFSLTRRGPREVELALDLEKVPDLSPMLMLFLLDELQRRPEIKGATRSEMYELTEKLKRGATALTAMTMRDRYVQLAVSGPRVVASQGATSSDAGSARFRVTYAELSALLLSPEARRGKRFAVTIAY